MKKTILKILFATLFFLAVSQSVMAADLNLTCNSSSCTPASNPALFPSSEIWYPGKTLVKTVNFSNIAGDSISVSVTNNNSSATGGLDAVVNLNIKRVATGVSVFNDTVKNFYGATIDLPTLIDGASEDYEFTAIMNSEAGNEYQNKQTGFDLAFNFTVGTASSSSSGGGGGGGTVAGATAPVCNDQKPGSAPVLQSAVLGVNSVTLNWTEASSPVSYYLVAYGVFPSNNTYGNPNVGGPGTTSYTVSGLSGGSNYCFIVRAGNGCAPGDFSNQICTTPSGGLITAPATGFEAGVLGVATESATLKVTPTITGAGSVKGVNDTQKSCKSCIWWQILLGELIVLIIYYYILVKDKLMTKTYLIGFAVPVLAYVVFYILNRACGSSFIFIVSSYFFCKYFILLDLGIYGFISLIKKNKTEKNLP